MINLKPIVLNKLKEIDCTVNYFHPQNINQLPVITYYELDNRTLLYEDDRELLAEITYSIDVWCKDSTSELSIEADKKMRSLGFKRTMSMDLFEPDTKIHHKVMRYVVQVTDTMQAHND